MEAPPEVSAEFTRVRNPPSLNTWQEQVVVPISKHTEKPLQARTEELFPRETLDRVVSRLDQTTVEEILTRYLPYSEKKPTGLTAEQATEIAKQDVHERAMDHATIRQAIEGKIAVAQFLKQAVQEELDAEYARQKSDVDGPILESMLEEVGQHIEGLKASIAPILEIKSDPFEDSKEFQKQKKVYIARSNRITAVGLETERVSPTMATGSDFHKGVVQAHLGEILNFNAERSSAIYLRENAGSWANLLGLNIGLEYGLPDATATARRQVEVSANGMAALSSVLESAEGLNPETIITEGFYYELPELARRHGTIKETTPVGEDLYFDIAKKLKVDSAKPLVIFAQPFGSGIGEEVFDLDRMLGIIKSAEGKRPVVLILDTTMHGASINKWQEVREMTEQGKDFTFIQVQSMVKHGQIGLDAFPGGVSLAYGSRPEIVRTSTSLRGSGMSESIAANLFPFSSELQMNRVQRAGRNAEYIKKRLTTAFAENPIIKGVFHASDNNKDAAEQYKIHAPFLFLKLNPIVPNNCISIAVNNMAGLHNVFPEAGMGTSWGFDGTRFERMNVTPDKATSIRIAAGQESSLLIMGIAHHIESRLNDPRFITQVEFGVKAEMKSLKSPVAYDKESLKYITLFTPGSNSQDEAEGYLFMLDAAPLAAYLHDQSRGHTILNEITQNPDLKKQLKISDEEQSELASLLDKPEQVRKWATDLAIASPLFLEKFREKLTVAGRSMSQERAYQLAKILYGNKGVRIVLKPLAEIANAVLKDIQPALEGMIDAKLPFDF